MVQEMPFYVGQETWFLKEAWNPQHTKGGSRIFLGGWGGGGPKDLRFLIFHMTGVLANAYRSL